MLLIGSQALVQYLPKDFQLREKMLDLDYICTEEEWEHLVALGWDNPTREGNKGIIKSCFDLIEEYEIATPGSSASDILEWSKERANLPGYCAYGRHANLNLLYMLKMSHRFKKNSPHFLKTMKDIHLMRSLGAEITPDLQPIYEKRMKETYTYAHPKLNVQSNEFFSNDGVPYVYEHDDIHEAVALLYRPAFKYYMTEGAEVMTSKDKFFSVDETIRLLGVYEETCVLALERSQIPNNFEVDPHKSFITALMKVCTSITSGWFREYAWENFFKVMELYNKMGKDDYIIRFKEKESSCRLYGEKHEENNYPLANMR